MRVHPDQWRPVDVDELEPAAEEAVRSDRSLLVTAGPGAGKTELLAQRGCYLLQTGLCPAPRKILAVSFKVDAAANLAKRVAKRSGNDARRFHSMTLDAFAKGLVERFRMGLPPEYRPVERFVPRMAAPRDAELAEFLRGLDPPEELGGRADLEGIPRNAFYQADLAGCSLSWPEEESTTLRQWAASEYWREVIRGSASESGALTFAMISRLSELVLRANPGITSALRSAYPFVFIDEFQDTMPWHYDILRVAFLESDARITAVGDTKQRIMLWAGAHPRVSENFVTEFRADTKELLRNYRSAPELVRMQNELARLLEEDPTECEPAGEHAEDGVCQVLDCDDAEAEAKWIADQVETGIEAGMSPDDFCIVCRQRVAIMSAPTLEELNSRGILARDETVYQDLADEIAVRILVTSIRAALSGRDPDAWCELTAHVRGIHGLSDDDGRAERIAAGVIAEAKRQFCDDPCEETEVYSACVALLAAIDQRALQEAVPAYSRSGWLDEVVKKTSALLARDRGASADWAEAVARFQGARTVKAMTIHKSKGLEYHTVIFIGLESSSWWAYARQEEEERRAFFVAFSRAIDRVVFTFARQRDSGRGVETQRRTELMTLYNALGQAGAVSLSV
ncbi:MAG: ATP-dependent helicase [Planctomycetes bacterium]|nr:ATP-dependent helicase [Planctomycetota bacterium]NOG53333.1 ATP-dependent helicase [Planctomycetota bacterium]